MIGKLITQFLWDHGYFCTFNEELQIVYVGSLSKSLYIVVRFNKIYLNTESVLLPEFYHKNVLDIYDEKSLSKLLNLVRIYYGKPKLSDLIFRGVNVISKYIEKRIRKK